MEKKAYFERLRAELESKLKMSYHSLSVKINPSFSRLVVVFPPGQKSIFYLEMDTIAEFGSIVWVSYFTDHFEIDVRLFNFE